MEWASVRYLTSCSSMDLGMPGPYPAPLCRTRSVCRRVRSVPVERAKAPGMACLVGSARRPVAAPGGYHEDVGARDGGRHRGLGGHRGGGDRRAAIAIAAHPAALAEAGPVRPLPAAGGELDGH